MGELIDRREVVLRGLGLLGGASLLGLAGCGSKPGEGGRATQLARTSIAIDYSSFYAPYPDLKRLVLARAKQRGAAVLFSDDPSGSDAQIRSLRQLTGEDGGFRVVVVAPFDASALAPQVAAARKRGIDVISFVTAVPGQSAAIEVDAADAARRLAREAARWAERRGIGSALVVTPPARSPIPDPFLSFAQEGSRALLSALASGPLRVAGTVSAIGAADAEEAVRAAGQERRVVLGWNDATALGAAAALPPSAWVGAMGAPALTGRPALAALQGPGPLRCLVAPRLADLADALVSLPLAVLQGRPPGSLTVPVRRFARGSDVVRAAREDYAA